MKLLRGLRFAPRARLPRKTGVQGTGFAGTRGPTFEARAGAAAFSVWGWIWLAAIFLWFWRRPMIPVSCSGVMLRRKALKMSWNSAIAVAILNEKLSALSLKINFGFGTWLIGDDWVVKVRKQDKSWWGRIAQNTWGLGRWKIWKKGGRRVKEENQGRDKLVLVLEENKGG